MSDKLPPVLLPAPIPILSLGLMSLDIQARLLAFQKLRNVELPPVGLLSRLLSAKLTTRRSLGIFGDDRPTTPDMCKSSANDMVLASPMTGVPSGESLSKKPLLSQRRGMKLDMSDLSVTPPITDTPPELTVKRQFLLKLPSLPPPLEEAVAPAPLLFDLYKKYIDIQLGELRFAGKALLHSKGVDFSSGHSFRISLEELEYIGELGRGNYGCVLKVLHKPTGVTMAMKEVRLELDETKFTQILMELDILHRCNSPYIVDFYGAFFVEGAVYMCMEYMDGGLLDKIYGLSQGVTDELLLAYISECVIRGLKELKDTHNIIHRDVKPTNILINTQGKVKLCDFGVLGNLVALLAKTNIGCQSYMAPERIYTGKVSQQDTTYSVQLDVWSLGITLLEVARGNYPYPPETYGNIFSQLSAIVDGEPPKLDAARFSSEAQQFVLLCLQKNPEKRPLYSELLRDPWLCKVDDRCEEKLSEEVKDRIATLGEAVNRPKPLPLALVAQAINKPVQAQPGRRRAPLNLLQNRGFGR